MRGLTVALTASLLSLALAVLSHTASLVGYHRAALRASDTMRVGTTNLRGLAVPTDAMLERLTETLPPEFRNQVHPPATDLVTQQQYVESLLEAAAFLQRSGAGAARVLVLDHVNPMPFILGAPSPKGGSLWLWPETPARAAESVFGDVDVVLVPRFGTDPSSTLSVMNTYAGYVSREFPVRHETPRWIVLRRQSPT
jgi:hypothetical protein